MNNHASPPPNDSWTRLAAAARRAPAPSPPLVGDDDFSARVVARWLRPPAATSPAPAFLAPLWEAWSLRGLAAAGALALVVLAFSFPALQDGAAGQDALSLDPLDGLLADF